MKNLAWLLALVVTAAIEIYFLMYILKRVEKENVSMKYFVCVVTCMILWCVVLIIQILIIDFISPSRAIYADYVVYIFIALMPVFLFLFSYAELTGRTQIKQWQFIFFLVTFFNLCIIWTNDFHHIFYIKYSTEFPETVFGPYYKYVYCPYEYGLTATGIILLIIASIKETSIKSNQTILIFVSVMIPLTVNFLASMQIIPANIYETPISFSTTVVILGITMFRYNFLNISPIATTRIVNQMSDAYLVLNIYNKVLDCNAAYENIFKVTKGEIVGKYLKELNLNELVIMHDEPIGNYLEKAQKSNATFKVNAKMKDESRYFNVEISRIISDYKCVGILILFKDVTQHIMDMRALKQNQDIMMERERLASLGQMVGGIAHNLKTPIMSIAGAMEGMQDLINEYDKSIDDPEVTREDHHAIAKDMSEWVTKVNSYDAYMSDVITAVKGQAVNFNEVSDDTFTIEELLKRVNILMKHELKNALVTLNVHCAIPANTIIRGNVNSLVQIVNNLISNAIQAYEDPEENIKNEKENSLSERNAKNNKNVDKKNSNSDENSTKNVDDSERTLVSENRKIIDLDVVEKNGKIVISVKDYGCGILPKVQEKLFKSMITTKGHNGTGLGLFMSYSNIKGHFNGDLSFTSELGKGTTFFITIPKT